MSLEVKVKVDQGCCLVLLLCPALSSRKELRQVRSSLSSHSIQHPSLDLPNRMRLLGNIVSFARFFSFARGPNFFHATCSGYDPARTAGSPCRDNPGHDLPHPFGRPRFVLGGHYEVGSAGCAI